MNFELVDSGVRTKIEHMIPEFKNLSEAEISLLKNVPAKVTILIAGADDQISNSELQEAISLTKIKQKKARKELLEYYNAIAPQFEAKLLELLKSYPPDPELRARLIIDELERLNEILPKMDARWSAQFVESMRDIAKKVAESTGGVFGYLSIGHEEAKLIDLNMIKEPARV